MCDLLAEDGAIHMGNAFPRVRVSYTCSKAEQTARFGAQRVGTALD